MQKLLYLCALFVRRQMNYLTLIMVVAILFGLTDFLTERYPNLQRDIYYIAFATIAFLCTIKYYYGPDVANYVPFYEHPGSMEYILSHPDELPYGFEPGYAIFCRWLKTSGVSFYWMTAIISIMYFVAVGLLFRKIESKRAFALAILVVLDYNIILYEYRQCMSVAAFIFMILLMEKRHYIPAAVCAIVAITCHKAGMMVVIPTLIFYILTYNTTPKHIFAVLLVALIFMLVLPITNISVDFISRLPFSHRVLYSMEHHLSIGKQVQSVFIVYVVVLMCLVHYAQFFQTRAQAIAGAALIGIACIVLLYQYYYLLNRIRSYFTPILLVYIFNYVQNAEKRPVRIPYGQLVKQATCFVMLVYMVHVTVALHRNEKSMHNHVNEACTVFDLRGDVRAKDVQRKQLNRAEKYWEEDFMKAEQNKIR